MSCDFPLRRDTPEDAARADAHLAGCADCRARAELDLPESRASFGDLAARLAADRPQGCDAHAEALSALATGEPEPAAEAHLETCAACRDRLDHLRRVWELYVARSPEASAARFADLRRRLVVRPWREVSGIAAAALIGLAFAWASLRPAPPVPTALERLLDDPAATEASIRSRAGKHGILPGAVAAYLSSDVPARRRAAVRILDALGGADAVAVLTDALGKDPSLDVPIATALARRGAAVERLVEMAESGRKDVMAVLVEAAPEGSAEALLLALNDDALERAAAAALARLKVPELRRVLGLYSYGPTPEEAAALVGVPHAVVRDFAVVSAGFSRVHRQACFARALELPDAAFVLAAAATEDPDLQRAAAAASDALDPAALERECERALTVPSLSLGAVRLASRHGFRRLAPAILAVTSAAPEIDVHSQAIFTTDEPPPARPSPLRMAGLEALGTFAGRTFATVEAAREWVEQP